MKPVGIAWTIVFGLITLAANAPMLIALSNALLPLIIVLGVLIVAVRLTFFHTRKW